VWIGRHHWPVFPSPSVLGLGRTVATGGPDVQIARSCDDVQVAPLSRSSSLIPLPCNGLIGMPDFIHGRF
jgi:hypothetical protein